MAAGDLVVQDGQFELRASLMGAGTAIGVDHQRGAIQGLLTNPAKEAEVEYSDTDGSFIGDVHRAARTATFNLIIRHQAAADAGILFESMLNLWDPVGSAVQPLHFRLWGWGKRYVNGRPMGIVDADLTEAPNGTIPFAALFRITDPTVRT